MKVNSYAAPYREESQGRNVTEGEGTVAGRKYMDRVSGGERVNLFHEPENSATIEISEEGLAKLLEVRNENPDMHILSYEEKVQLLQDSLQPAQKLHRIIPNIQTNDKLEKSLQGADEDIVDAAYAIIKKNLLPHEVGNLTERERQELILAGVEEAKKLAEKMDADKAGLFMEAMETIAKYGMNGKKDSQGNVTYDIRWGAPVGAPDDYINSGELMKRIAPKQYERYSAMLEEGLAKKDTVLLAKAVRFAIDWEVRAYRENPQPFEEEKQKQLDWKRKMDNTKLEVTI